MKASHDSAVGFFVCVCVRAPFVHVYARRRKSLMEANGEKHTRNLSKNWINQLSCAEDLITMSLGSHVIILCQHGMNILLAP